MDHGRLASGVVLNGTYRIVRLLGKGGVGEVYEAVHDRLSKKRFAVKVLIEELSGREEVIDRFRREADVLSALGHPNIVEISDFAQTPAGISYLVMEFVDGVDLAKEIQLHGPMPPAKVARIIGQLASALDAVHSRGIIHRDLKPGNVILTRRPGQPDEFVKILDFGIAKVREATVQLTRQEAILGTPQYMAPEQASGHLGEIDERTDQFSLAAIAYELVTGEPPFGGQDATTILFRVVNEPPTPFRLPLPATEAAILRGMSKRKAQRFASVQEFHRALAEAAATDVWPPPVVGQTMVEQKPQTAAPPPADKSEPTAVLPGNGTTLSKAVGASTAERVVAARDRRWLWPALVIVALAAAGVVVATVRLVGPSLPHAEGAAPGTPAASKAEPAAPVVPTPVVLSAPTPTPRLQPDASARDALAPARVQPPTATQPEPSSKSSEPSTTDANAKKHRKPAGKNAPRIRNDDL